MTDSKPANPTSPRKGHLIKPTVDKLDATPTRKPRPKAAPPKPAGWLAYLALMILTIGSYAPMFTSELIWSEYDQVERSPYQSMETWTEAWTPEMIRREDPITLTSYFLEQLIPLDPAITHHTINLLLHITAAILLLKTLEALKLPAAFSAALIFSLHPSVLQTIFWSGYREELVGLILLLAALYFGVRNRNTGDFILLVLLSAIGLMIHPAMLSIPLLLGLCIFHQKASFNLKNYNRLLPLFCLALFIGVWTHGSTPGQNILFSERMGIYAQNLYFYLKQALFPLELALFHPLDQTQGYNVGTQNSLLPFLLFLPFYVLIAIYYRKPWARSILMGLTAYLLLTIYGLSKTGTFINGDPAHEDHFHYIALPIIVALAICTFGGIVRKMGGSGKILWAIGLTAFIATQIAVTSTYAFNVSNRMQLWHHMSEQWPEAWLPKLALIDTIQDSDEESQLFTQDEIIIMLESILEQQPDRSKERKLLARIYREEEQNTNALRHYKYILRDSKTDNAFLLEAAEFYEQIGLTWEANNARERINR